MGDGAVSLNNRWIRVRPSVTVPAYACVEVTGTSIVDNELVVEVKRPSADSLPPSKVMFISNVGIAANEIGLGTYSFPCWARCSLAAGAGSVAGTEKDQFELKANRKGFYVSDNDAGIARVKPKPYFNDEDCNPEWPIYVNRYECERNELYIDDTSSSQATPEEDTYDCCDWENPIGYLYEYRDTYTWDKDLCEWVFYQSGERGRRIMCCDYRCANDPPPEDCVPCAPKYYDDHEQCCGETVNIEAPIDCGTPSEVEDVDYPTQVWLEETGPAVSETQVDCDTRTEVANSRQIDANGIRNYVYEIQGPTCGSLSFGTSPNRYEVRGYKIRGAKCFDKNDPEVSTECFYIVWKECTPPTCTWCPDDDQQPFGTTFTAQATVTGWADGIARTVEFQPDTSLGDNTWWARFEGLVEDSNTGDLKNLEFYVKIACYDLGMIGVGFDSAAGQGESLFYCEVDAVLPVTTASALSNPVNYGSSDTVNFTANEILSVCGIELDGDTNLQLTLEPGPCT